LLNNVKKGANVVEKIKNRLNIQKKGEMKRPDLEDLVKKRKRKKRKIMVKKKQKK
jgi:hypothetical protein